MNMVRVNVVDHPAKWQHGSAHELTSSRQRYRIVDRQRLVERLGFPDWDVYWNWYEAALLEVLGRKLFIERQAFWTDSPAVGGAEWVENVAAQSGMKRYNTVEIDLDWPESVKSVFLRGKKVTVKLGGAAHSLGTSERTYSWVRLRDMLTVQHMVFSRPSIALRAG